MKKKEKGASSSNKGGGDGVYGGHCKCCGRCS